MRILVTGGAGFIGGHAVDRLAADGHALQVVDDLSAGRRENLPADVELVVDTIAHAAAGGAVERFRPEAIVHLAAQVDARRSVAEPLHDAQVNLLDTLALLEAARRADCRCFVFASSAAVYGEPATLPAAETDRTAPVSPYGAAKLAVERYLEPYRRGHGFAAAALRFANVYGPRQSAAGEAGVVALFSTALAAGRQAVVFGDGRQTRDYVYVGDVAEAIARAISRLADGVWNVSTGVETDLLAVHALLASRLAPGVEPRFAPARPGDPARSALSSAAIERDLGWRARTPLAAGLAATAEWFRARGGNG